MIEDQEDREYQEDGDQQFLDSNVMDEPNSQLLEEQEQEQEQAEEDDVIDIDNPEDLARRGLKRIKIEGDTEEYLLDEEGNIYNLQGEFVG